LVEVAIASASAGVYQRVNFARRAPWCQANSCENRMSVPKAVFSLYFFASAWRPTDKCAGRRQGLRGRLNVGVANIVRQGRGGIRPHQHRMPIRVDQAGHQDAPAAVNRSRTSDRDVDIRSILLSLTKTLDGAESAPLFPSKIRTF
jgi:hypothetical protein